MHWTNRHGNYFEWMLLIVRMTCRFSRFLIIATLTSARTVRVALRSYRDVHRFYHCVLFLFVFFCLARLFVTCQKYCHTSEVCTHSCASTRRTHSCTFDPMWREPICVQLFARDSRSLIGGEVEHRRRGECYCRRLYAGGVSPSGFLYRLQDLAVGHICCGSFENTLWLIMYKWWLHNVWSEIKSRGKRLR